MTSVYVTLDACGFQTKRDSILLRPCLQGDLSSLPAGFQVDAVLLLDAKEPSEQLRQRLPEILTPQGVAVLCNEVRTLHAISRSAFGRHCEHAVQNVVRPGWGLLSAPTQSS